MSRHIYIIGVCGTAMAAVAKLARDLGYDVSGSDENVYPPMSDFLHDQHISVHEGFNASHLKTPPDFVVIGNAMSRGNVEVEAVLDQGLTYVSGPEFIGRYVLPGRHAVVVAGTHGKTTTASLMAHVLEAAGMSPGLMIGGMPEDFGSGARLGDGECFVLEGDEYDTAFFDKRSKFLHYHARTLILNNLEYDHADIFPDLAAIETQFHHLIRTVPHAGHITVNADDANLAGVLARGCWTPVTTFAEYGAGHRKVEAEWQWQALEADGSAFCLYRNGERIMQVRWSMIGVHHVANACAVAATAINSRLDTDTVRQAFESFAGIRRRMTLVGEAHGIRIYDDFAHHPTSIAGVVTALAARLSDSERLWAIVEPRSNTMRTRTHQQRLPRCFDGANRVIFVPASSRNLQPDDVLDTNAVCRDIGEQAQVLPDVDAIIECLKREARAGDHVLVLSNGNFGNIHQRLLTALNEREGGDD